MKETVWQCKIGTLDQLVLPPGQDAPMRQAIREAYFRITGQYPQFIFSGWGSELTEGERNVVLNK